MLSVLIYGECALWATRLGGVFSTACLSPTQCSCRFFHPSILPSLASFQVRIYIVTLQILPFQNHAAVRITSFSPWYNLDLECALKALVGETCLQDSAVGCLWKHWKTCWELGPFLFLVSIQWTVLFYYVLTTTISCVIKSPKAVWQFDCGWDM